MLKISFCTVSMNRLHHIRETLPANMAANTGYENLEFVLFDYNSGDGLADWVHENFSRELKKGKLIFGSTDTPDHFDRSRSRNMAFRLATGDIVCNVDADNFTGPDFAAFVNRHFQTEPDSYLSVNYKDNLMNFSDTYGRIACLREDFETVGGFDESMEGYGYEDIDLCQRLSLLGRKQYFIVDKKFHKTIRHGYNDRFSRAAGRLKIRAVFVNYRSPFRSGILFLFDDNRCAYGTLQDEDEGMGNPTIEEKRWLTGRYKRDGDNNLIIHLQDYSMELACRKENFKDSEGRVYYKIIDKNYLIKLETLYPIIGNHQILVNNMKEQRVRVNEL